MSFTLNKDRRQFEGLFVENIQGQKPITIYVICSSKATTKIQVYSHYTKYVEAQFVTRPKMKLIDTPLAF